jgi:hypothetical protein
MCHCDDKTVRSEGIGNKFRYIFAKFRYRFAKFRYQAKISLTFSFEINITCKGNKQKQVHDFFGKNKSKYPYIQFFPCNNDPSKNEDTFTHLRNNIAHSKSAGIHKFYETSQSITHMEIASILQVINDIISGETNVL